MQYTDYVVIEKVNGKIVKDIHLHKIKEGRKQIITGHYGIPPRVRTIKSIRRVKKTRVRKV